MNERIRNAISLFFSVLYLLAIFAMVLEVLTPDLVSLCLGIPIGWIIRDSLEPCEWNEVEESEEIEQ